MPCSPHSCAAAATCARSRMASGCACWDRCCVQRNGLAPIARSIGAATPVLAGKRQGDVRHTGVDVSGLLPANRKTEHEQECIAVLAQSPALSTRTERSALDVNPGIARVSVAD